MLQVLLLHLGVDLGVAKAFCGRGCSGCGGCCTPRVRGESPRRGESRGFSSRKESPLGAGLAELRFTALPKLTQSQPNRSSRCAGPSLASIKVDASPRRASRLRGRTRPRNATRWQPPLPSRTVKKCCGGSRCRSRRRAATSLTRSPVAYMQLGDHVHAIAGDACVQVHGSSVEAGKLIEEALHLRLFEDPARELLLRPHAADLSKGLEPTTPRRSRIVECAGAPRGRRPRCELRVEARHRREPLCVEPADVPLGVLDWRRH